MMHIEVYLTVRFGIGQVRKVFPTDVLIADSSTYDIIHVFAFYRLFYFVFTVPHEDIVVKDHMFLQVHVKDTAIIRHLFQLPGI